MNRGKFLRNMNCLYCGKANLANLRLHDKTCSEKDNPNRDEKYAKAKKLSSESRAGKPGRPWTLEQRQQHSRSMRKAVLENPESYRGRFNRGRCPVVYKGESYDSRWELVVKKHLDSLGVTSTREVEPQDYRYLSVTRSYFPDFFLPDLKAYVEVKGFVTKRDFCKWKSFEGKLLILTKLSIRQIESGKVLFDVAKVARKRSQITVDGIPIEKSRITAKTFLGGRKKAKLSFEERSKISRAALAASPVIKERQRLAVIRKLERSKGLHPSYTGERGSKFGTFWITNGVNNKKMEGLQGQDT
jgi:hypothetical protein